MMCFISDEVVSAFGRLGHWFASEEVFGIQPDIITCAKGLTSGYIPMGACLISERVFAPLVGGVECVAGDYSDDNLQLHKTVGARIDEHCQELGLIVRPLYNMCVFSPPLVINEKQINEMFDILGEGIKRATKDLQKEGLFSS